MKAENIYLKFEFGWKYFNASARKYLKICLKCVVAYEIKIQNLGRKAFESEFPQKNLKEV